MEIIWVLCGLILLALLWFYFARTWRQKNIIKPLAANMRKKLPPISQTEREAINAGNTWWEKELFCGRPDWNSLFSLPKPTMTTEEQSFLDNQVEHLCSLLNDWQIIFEDHDLPKTVWAYLKQEKFFGLAIPKQYGGHGFSALAHSTVVTKIATRSISAAVNTMVPNSLGPAELILHYGTDEQKNHYLPRLASGLDIPCFALTAPEAGSDASAIPDTGIVCRGKYQGKEVIGIRLNWDKRYITLAPIATVLGLAFHLYDPDHLLGEKSDIGITLCLIPTSHPGVEIGSRHFPMMLAFMNGPTRGKDVFIPLDWIIGGSDRVGQGWRMLMECLSIGRSISLPALATACSKVAYRYTGAYAQLRYQFNTPLAAFEGIEESLGKIAGYTYILESARIMTAGAVDLKITPSTASAIAKYHMTELGRKVVDCAMDIHAGHMIQTGPRNFLANYHLAMPISITVEGANILTRNLIIFGQGAIRCHPYLLDEIELLSAPEVDISKLDKILMSHIGFFIRNLFKNIGYGLTGGLFIFANLKNKQVKRLQRQITRMSAALALLADTSLILLGGSLKRRERISARLGDIMSQLYLASAVMKHYHDLQQAESEVDYVCWSLQHCLFEIQIAIDGLLNNYPRPWIGKILHAFIFPFGTAYYESSDELSKKIVAPMLSHSAFRDRLTAYCYTGHLDDESIKRLDKALMQQLTIDPIRKKINAAAKTGVFSQKMRAFEKLQAAKQAGIITAQEAETLAAYDLLANEIIKVNEFNFKLDKVIA